MKISLVEPLAVVACVVALSACSKKADPPPVPKTAAAQESTPLAAAPPAPDHRDDPIAWRRGDAAAVDAAFVEAKAANKPVFLYWGATWCPPCNQMKATLFNRRDFIERTTAFVPVYVDGDSPAAQTLGTRFAVSGYPTMVLFKPDGTEITRLPGEADPERYLQVLAIGMNAGARPVRVTLERALAGGRGLSHDDWRMLAWYSWDTDDDTLVPKAGVPATLKALASGCPADFADARSRLALKTAAADARPAAAERAARLAAVEAVVASPTASRENFDLLAGALPDIVRQTTAAGTPDRARLVAAADAALAGLAADASLSNTDRLDATTARVELAALDTKDGAPPPLSDALRATVVSEVARVDRDSRDPLERQTTINSAANLLSTAGMLDASDALLRAELARSHSPYYFMLDLAANAKKRGDKAAAIDWYGQAYDAAKGPATRLQWGATYVAALVDLAPADAARIERAASQVVGEIDPVPASFEGRNRRRLSQMSAKLATWNANGAHAAEAARVATEARALCTKLPADAPERARCATLLNVA